MRCNFLDMFTAGLGPAQARVFHDIRAESGKIPFGIHAKEGAGAGAGARHYGGQQRSGTRMLRNSLPYCSITCWESWCNEARHLGPIAAHNRSPDDEKAHSFLLRLAHIHDDRIKAIYLFRRAAMATMYAVQNCKRTRICRLRLNCAQARLKIPHDRCRPLELFN